MTLREPGQPESSRAGYGDIGEAMTKGEYDALCDSDVRPWPTPVQHLLAAILEEPDDDWRSRAGCHPVNRHTSTEQEWTDMWFPKQGGRIGAAIAICAACPVQTECFEEGVGERWGIWGGKSEIARRRYRRGLPEPVRPQNRPKPINHGTPSGVQAHYRRGEDPCRACLAAKAQQTRQRRAARKAEAA